MSHGDDLPAAWPLRSGCTVDLVRQQVRLAGEVVPLTSRETALLAYLIAREGQDVSVEELHQQVWGHDPAVISRAAQNAVHRLKRKIEVDPARPQHLLTVHGMGFRLVRATEVEALPVASTVFVSFGREAERTELGQLLDSHPVVTLSGLGGIGKTHLAHAVQRERGGLFVDLTGVVDDDGLLRAVAGALGVTRADAGPTHLGRALRGLGATLVVLDNAEQIATAVRDTLAVWLDLAPRVHWLVTSRVRLGLYGEQLLSLGPLPVPDHDASADQQRTSAAVQLFLTRADHDPGALADVAALVRELEGIPLAIELAAARTSVTDAAGIRARLRQHLAMLRRPGGTGRHDAVATTLQWSWSLLQPLEKHALAQCSVFRGPFRLEAAEAVVALPDDVFPLDVVQTLVEASLIHRVAGASPPRLRLYTVVREFAASRLTDLEPVAGRHARFFSRHGAPGRDLSDRCPTASADTALRDAELEDLIAATDWTLAARDAPAALDAARALAAAIAVRGPRLGARNAVEGALELAAGVPGLGPRRVSLRVQWCSLLAKASLWPEVEQVVAAARADNPDPSSRAQLHMVESLRHLFAGRLEQAEQSWQAATDGAGPDRALSAQLLNLGAHLALRRRRPERARAMLDRGLELAAGQLRLTRPIHSALGTVLRAQGDAAAALEHKHEALRQARELGTWHDIADALEGLGAALSTLGRSEEAEQAYAEATGAWARLGRTRPTLLANRAELALDRGDPATARLLAREGAARSRESGAALLEGVCLAIEGRGVLEEGDPSTALPILARARALLPATEPRVVAQLDLWRAIALARTADPGARGLLTEASEKLAEVDSDALHTTLARGEVEAALGDMGAARIALGEAEVLAKSTEAPRLQRLLVALRDRLA